MDHTLRWTYTPTVARVVAMIRDGTARELAVIGPRGEGKTSAVLSGIFEHALRHARARHSLPTIWLGATDTYENHRSRTHTALLEPWWHGLWSLRDGGRLAVASLQGRDFVHLRLFGLDDLSDWEKLRTACHGVWFDEPAPAAIMGPSRGMAEDAWTLAMTSQRLPTHAYVAVMSLNAPDEDHWTWQRFVVRQHPGTAYVRIPKGERTTEAQRAEWARALEGRPDLVRRLLEGEPGVVSLGPQVAQGFVRAVHAPDTLRLEPIPSEPLGLGWDFGHTPACVIGQAWRGQVRVYAALTIERGGIRQLIEQGVRPWLARAAPWALEAPGRLLHGIDPSGETGEQTDIDQSPARVIETLLGGLTWRGPIPWPARIGPLLALLGRMVDGQPALQIDPRGAEMLVRALDGRWHYPVDRLGRVGRDLPAKPNHPWEDLGDALCYLLARLAGPTLTPRARPRPPLRYQRVLGAL